MTPEAQAYLDKADLALAKAQAMLTVGYPDEAGRLAYYAAHHAAQALIFERTAKTSKSHKGVKAQFARIAKAEGLPRDLIAFLARTYPMKGGRRLRDRAGCRGSPTPSFGCFGRRAKLRGSDTRAYGATLDRSATSLHRTVCAQVLCFTLLHSGAYIPKDKSQHLKDIERPSVAYARAGSYRANSIHPRIVVRAGFKVRSRPEIVVAWIDVLTAIEAIDDLLGTMAKSFPAHVNQLLVLGFEHNSNIDLQDVVASYEHPTTATRQHCSPQPWAFESP